MAQRIIVAVLMAAIGIPAIILGGVPYFLLIAVFLGMAAWEYVNIFRAMKLSPSMWVTVGSVLLIMVARAFFPDFSLAVLTLAVLVAMTVHLIDYERGVEHAGADFAATLSGFVYIGWIGSYLLDLRAIGGNDLRTIGGTNGLWFLLISLGAIWAADSMAYFIGSRFGRHKMVPRLSPKKSWEGYWTGVFFGTLGGAGLTLLCNALNGPDILWWQGAILGLILSVFTTLGDLGESMLKRQAKMKDSSTIIPGHGGFFDRIDAWLWAAAMGYFFIHWFIYKV